MSIKELLTRILNRFGSVSFSGTRDASITAGECIGYYDKASDLVHINFWARSTTSISTSIDMFSIPEPYRPKETKKGQAVLSVGGNPYAYEIYISSTGLIYQGFSNSVTDIFGNIVYNLGG